MEFIFVFLIAVGLSMDAFAVAISCGIDIKKLSLKHPLIIALSFGFFQFFMPIVGWFLGSSIQKYIAAFDHWIAFGLLSYVGIKMIYEAVQNKGQECINIMNFKNMMIMSIATSIDALAVGLSFALLGSGIIWPSVIIGITTFVISFVGVYIGKFVGILARKKAAIIGGVILILIGFKILIEHLFF